MVPTSLNAKIILSWITAIICTLASLLTWQCGVFKGWNEKLLGKYQSLEPAPKDLPVELITIQRTGDQAWPWSSLDYAILLNALSPFAPKVTVLDLPLESGDSMYPIYDMQLANQMGRFGVMILASESHPYSPANDLIKEEESSLILPHKTLRSASTGTAPVNFLSSPESTLTRAPLVFFGGRVPSLALEAYIAHLGADWSRSRVVPGDSIYLSDPDGKRLARIPIDAEYRMLLDLPLFAAKVKPMEFYAAIIAAEELRNGNPDRQGFADIRNKTLLVGTEADGTYEPITTPAGKVPPAHVQYQILQQLLASRFTYELSPLFYCLILVSGSAAAAAFALLPSRLGSLSLLLLYMVLLAISSYFSFALGRLWWPLLPALAGAPLTWLCIRGIRSYLTPADEKQPELFAGY